MGNNPFRGASYVLRGAAIVSRPGLRRFVLVPFLVNLLLFGSLLYWGLGALSEYIDGLLPDWLGFLSWILTPILWIGALIGSSYVFTVVANLIAAPFNSLLAEKVETQLRGHPLNNSDEDWKAIAKKIGPTVGSELRKLKYFLIRAIPLLILMLIPGINLIASILWIAFTAWFMAIEYGDYPMGNHEMLFNDQQTFHKENRLSSFGFGGLLMALTTIPVVNFFAMPVGVAGATAMWVDARPD